MLKGPENEHEIQIKTFCLGDGWCDDFNNVVECYFDAGDCCFNVNPQFCTNCNCYEDGNCIEMSIETYF